MKLLLLLFLTLNLSTVLAQKFSFIKFDNENLKSNFIYDIKQSDNNKLYIASSNGLITYDGISFDSYTTENGLIDNFITKVFIDHSNKVWFAYYNGGYGYIDNNEVITKDSVEFVLDFIENNKNIYIATAKKILIDSESTTKSLHISNTNKLLKLNNGILLQKDINNNIFIFDSLKTKQILSNVNFITASSHNNLIIYIQNNTICIEKVAKNGNLTSILNIDLLQNDIKINSINLHQNRLEILTAKNGVLEYTFTNNFTQFRLKSFNNRSGLLIKDIRCSLIDKEGNLWLGSYGNGISLLTSNRISIYDNKKDGQSYNINNIIEHNNKFYLATNNGLIVNQQETSSSQYFLTDLEIITLKIRNNTLWIGSKSNGVFTMKGNKIEPFIINSELVPSQINCIEFEEENVLFGTNSGLLIVNIETRETQQITTNEGLAHNVIEHFIIDKNRKFWFDSPNSPIYTYKNGEFDYYKNIDGFDSYNITDIKEDQNGDIWVSTAGDGVFQFKNNNYNHFTDADGLFSNYIYFIETKNKNNIYFGHKKGVSNYKYSDTLKAIQHVQHIDELEYILPKSNYFINNTLWIGTSIGLINIPTNLSFKKNYIPKIDFTSININTEEVDINKGINLKYGNHFVKFVFKSILLYESNSISYKYKLFGFDKNWTTTNSKKSFGIYQSLTDGHYTFKVKLYINGKYTGKSKSIDLNIEKPYWKQYWFYGLLLLLIIIIFIVILKVITKRNLQLRKKLASKIEKRTSDLNKKNKEIKLINSNLENLSNKYLEQKNIAITKSKEVLNSISYAKRIQKAIFRRSEYITYIADFKSLFLIFKPKDTVSGDFYWADKKGDNTYIAIGDCTGHGVPGAMISMLGVSLLSEIIEYEKQTDKILNALREKLIVKLGQEMAVTSIVQSRDGMDMAFLKYNNKTMLAQSSSAYNPIYIIREKSKGNADGLIILAELENLVLYCSHADKQPIGVYEKMTPFKSCQFYLLEGDNIFMMSDGYQDQFGGVNNKKFLRKRMYQTLFSVYGLDSQKQNKILWNTMQDWMGDKDQIDDITILGFTV